MSSTLANMNVGQFVTMAQRMFFPTEAIVNYTQLTSIAQMESIVSNLYDTIQSIPDSVFETLSDEESYSKEEIQEELEAIRAEGFPITDIEGLTPDQVEEKMWAWLWENTTSKPDVIYFVAMCNLYQIRDIQELFKKDSKLLGIDIALRDELYKAYATKPEMQEAVHILLGME